MKEIAVASLLRQAQRKLLGTTCVSLAAASIAMGELTLGIPTPVAAQATSIGSPTPYSTERTLQRCSVVIKEGERTRATFPVNPRRHIVRTEFQGNSSNGNLRYTHSKQYSFNQVRETVACEDTYLVHRYYREKPVHRTMTSVRFCSGGGCGPSSTTYSSWNNGH